MAKAKKDRKVKTVQKAGVFLSLSDHAKAKQVAKKRGHKSLSAFIAALVLEQLSAARKKAPVKHHSKKAA